jgi:NAD(P)H dehydrogenase (quinone)
MTTRIALIGGHGKTGRAVAAALEARGATPVPLGRADWDDLAGALRGCAAAYLIAPNLHPDEPTYVADALTALREAGVTRVGYHSVAAPYAPGMPHHVGKARGEDLVRRSGTAWTILQPGAYLQNLDLTRDVRVPYDVLALFGFADLADVGEAAATRRATVAELAAEAGVRAERVVPWEPPPGLDERERAWLQAMFGYYDRHGLPVGTLPLRALLGRAADAAG